MIARCSSARTVARIGSGRDVSPALAISGWSCVCWASKSSTGVAAGARLRRGGPQPAILLGVLVVQHAQRDRDLLFDRRLVSDVPGVAGGFGELCSAGPRRVTCAAAPAGESCTTLTAPMCRPARAP